MGFFVLRNERFWHKQLRFSQDPLSFFEQKEQAGFHASHVSAHLDEEEPESVEVQLMFANRWFHHAH